LKIDAFGGGQTVGGITRTAREVERTGFDGLWIPEGRAPVFSLAAVAAAAVSDLALGSGVAVAFARSPMVTAQAAWMLADATGGNFRLGLGTQVRAHVERRYSADFAPPGPRMREYVRALREIFAGFARRAKLSFQGDYYTFTLLPQAWTPAPIPFDDPPVYLAGVRPWMCRMIGEVADGMKVHPLHTLSYLESVVRPNLDIGCAAAGRTLADVELVIPVMTAVGDEEEPVERQREQLRQRLAFYGSTPGYGVVFDSSGWPGTGERLNELLRAGDLEGMTRVITDEMLDAMTVTATWSGLPKALAEKYQGRASRIVCYSAVEQWGADPASVERWQDVVREFRRVTGD
jgi:probable F420-dependent oxidoreductase